MELPVTVTRMAPEREHALVDLARADGSAIGELYDFHLRRVCAVLGCSRPALALKVHRACARCAARSRRA